MVALQSGRTSHDVTVRARTPAEIRQVADQVGEAADELNAAMTAALGPGWVHIDDQLRQQLGHDISSDLVRQLPLWL